MSVKYLEQNLGFFFVFCFFKEKRPKHLQKTHLIVNHLNIAFVQNYLQYLRVSPVEITEGLPTDHL